MYLRIKKYTVLTATVSPGCGGEVLGEGGGGESYLRNLASAAVQEDCVPYFVPQPHPKVPSIYTFLFFSVSSACIRFHLKAIESTSFN